MRVIGPPGPEFSRSPARRFGAGRTVALVVAVLLLSLTAFPALVPSSSGSERESYVPGFAALQPDDGTPISLDLNGNGATPEAASTPVGTPTSRPTREPELPISERPLNIDCYIPARQAVVHGDTAVGTADSSAATPMADDGTSIRTSGERNGTPMALPDGMTWAGVPAGAADELTARDIERLARILGTCLSDANYETITFITSEEFRGLLLGTEDPIPADSFIAFAEQFSVAVISVVSVENVEIQENGDATAIVRYQVGNQLLQGEWTFTLFVPDADIRPETAIAPAAARWTITAQEPQSVEAPDGAVELTVEIDEYEMDLSSDEVEGDTLVLTIENNGEQDHEVIVLRLEDGATTTDLLVTPGPDLPPGITVIGQQTVLAGDEAVMVLSGLEPGDYALVDLLPDVSGVPFLSLGVEAALTVEAD